MYFVNTFDVCVEHYSKKFPKLKVYLSCFGALYIYIYIYIYIYLEREKEREREREI